MLLYYIMVLTGRSLIIMKIIEKNVEIIMYFDDILQDIYLRWLTEISYGSLVSILLVKIKYIKQ